MSDATSTEKAVWAEWGTLPDSHPRPVKEIAERLELEPAVVAGIVYPPETMGTWSDDQEPDEPALRDVDEISAAVGKFFDRVWYERKLLETPDEMRARGVPEDIIEGMLAGMKRVEEEQGKEVLAPVNDFEWGMINGKLSALRWVLGDEWDFLDT